VPRVALTLLGRQPARNLYLVAAVFPERDAAAQRLDALVAEVLLERAGGERRTVARRAVEDDTLGAVGHDLLDPRLEMAARHVQRTGDVAGVPLVLLADVDHHDLVAGAVGVQRRVQIGRLDLANLLLDLLDQFLPARHYLS
jgi:hypothetical protein